MSDRGAGFPSSGKQAWPRELGEPQAVSHTSPQAVVIGGSSDIIMARQLGRELALAIGFASAEAVLIATAISELARNIVVYANAGEMRLLPRRERAGLTIVARDEGPGIRNVQRVLTGGYSTSGGLGLGIAGVRQIMDEFEVATSIGKGTEITATKWL